MDIALNKQSRHPYDPHYFNSFRPLFVCIMFSLPVETLYAAFPTRFLLVPNLRPQTLRVPSQPVAPSPSSEDVPHLFEELHRLLGIQLNPATVEDLTLKGLQDRRGRRSVRGQRNGDHWSRFRFGLEAAES